MATARAYELPFSILRGGRIDDVVLVSDDEMLRAIKELALNAGQVAELAGAAALAAAMKLRSQLVSKKVVVMVTGGNIDPELFMKALENY
ncbi:pyridoxal-phosphate dependent enzyme [Vulcanisaeta souniana]|uniref:pyridoxal-phosphate dependent enzyme n=1 Tax=Vulcanisaeta souniana TaxID=164452 RepID=UPI001FB2ED4F|nr:pyridoxal-phosphate dependent enzyme [Vulcanisaeta souniana]